MNRLTLLAVPALLAAVLTGPLPAGAVSAARTVLIPADRVVEEDLLAIAGSRVIVEGTIRGDLTVLTQELIVTGEVEGDINGAAWSMDLQGEVAGAVRAVGWEVDVGGAVGDDVVALAGRLEVTGDVGRDILVSAVSARHSGRAGGELRGELVWGLRVDGSVGEDIDVGVHRLTITDTASVQEGVNWRQGVIGQNIRGWSARAEVSPRADVGLVTEVLPRPTDIAYRALRLLFHVLRFVGFLFLGMLLLAVFPRVTRRAGDRAWDRPGPAFLIGLGLLVLTPIAAVVSLFTIVLAPLGLLAFGLWVFALFTGAIPALIALGRRSSSGSRSLLAGFVVAAIVWRLLRIIPLAGFFIWLLATIWGIGAWAMALWGAWRDSDQGPADLEPAAEGMAPALLQPGPRLELLGLEVPTDAGSDSDANSNADDANSDSDSDADDAD